MGGFRVPTLARSGCTPTLLGRRLRQPRGENLNPERVEASEILSTRTWRTLGRLTMSTGRPRARRTKEA